MKKLAVLASMALAGFGCSESSVHIKKSAVLAVQNSPLGTLVKDSLAQTHQLSLILDSTMPSSKSATPSLNLGQAVSNVSSPFIAFSSSQTPLILATNTKATLHDCSDKSAPRVIGDGGIALTQGLTDCIVDLDSFVVDNIEYTRSGTACTETTLFTSLVPGYTAVVPCSQLKLPTVTGPLEARFHYYIQHVVNESALDVSTSVLGDRSPDMRITARTIAGQRQVVLQCKEPLVQGKCHDQALADLKFIYGSNPSDWPLSNDSAWAILPTASANGDILLPPPPAGKELLWIGVHPSAAQSEFYAWVRFTVGKDLTTVECPLCTTDVPVEPAEPVAVCSKQEAFDLGFAVATHQDVAAGKVNRYHSNLPISDAAVSQVVRISSSAVRGNFLTPSVITLDDMAIIVRESDTVESILSVNAATGKRLVRVPDHAFIIFNADDPEYAAGSVDSDKDTTYQIKGKSILLTAGVYISLKEVFNMGMPLTRHDQISLTTLRANGFADAQGNVAFKVIHISHGYGFASMAFNVPVCQAE